MLECLDCADPSINTPVRSTTTTALQALALLNDPFMIQQAGFFAGRVKTAAATLDGKIRLAFRLAIARDPTEKELRAVTAYAAHYGLANACRLIYNLNEFVFID